MSEHYPGDEDTTVERTDEEVVFSERNRPAIGIDVTDADADALAGTLLRAQRHGFDSIVTYARDPDDEVLEVVQQLEVPVVEPSIGTTRESLVEAARNAGHPGVIYQHDLDGRVDFGRSEAALFAETDRYAADAVTEARTGDEPFVVAGIPAYNEGVAIGSVVIEAAEHADEVVVVDDGSEDDTARLARCADVTVIEHGENLGKGAALRTLFEYIRGEGFDALVLLDGDGQHSPAQIPEVVEPVFEGEADIAIGSRYMDGGNGDQTPRYRRVGQRVLDVLTMGSAGLKVTDSQSGFRALSPTAVERLRLRSDGFEVESEMIDVAVRDGLELVETPIEVRYDGVDGSSANPMRHGLAVVSFILQLIRDRHPLVFFGLPGVFVTTIGVMYGVEGILIYQNQGVFYPVKAMVSGFLTIIGILGVFLGLVLNSLANRIAEMQYE